MRIKVYILTKQKQKKMRTRTKLLTMALFMLSALGCSAHILQFSDEETRVYADNYDALAFRCNIAGQDALTELGQKYYVPKDCSMFLYHLFVEREVRKATYDYTRHNPIDRVRCKRMIDSLYQDSVDVRLMPYNQGIAGENISISLRMAKTLGISADRRADIMKLGLYVARQLRKNPRYYYDAVVMDSLRTFMTRKQLTDMLRSKNVVRAVNMARKAWKEVVAAGLIENEDSAECCDKAIEYYLQERVINDMYVGHDKALKSNLRELWKHQPLIVRMKESMRKKESMEQERRNENENNDNGMAW